MTKLLKQAFEEAQKLSPGRQDAVAKWLLAELASEERCCVAVMPAKAGTQCLMRLSRFSKDAGSLLSQG